MKNNRLFPGVVLVCIGLAFLLRTLGVLHFHWSNLLYLWPLILVIAGVNLLLAHRHEAWATAVRVLVVVVCLGLIFFGDFGYRYHFGNWRYNHHNNSYNFHSDDNDNNNNSDNDQDNDDDDDDDNNAVGNSSTYNQPWDANVKVASLNISGGATKYTLNDTTNQLMMAKTKEFSGRYTFDHRIVDSSAVIDLSMKGRNVMNMSGKSNTTEVLLNSKPLWDISIKGGADELKFDLSKFKVRNLKLSGGATDYTVKMGMPLAETHVNISAGVSDITINVPANAACDVTTSTGLSSNNINGLNKVSDNHYQTGNFASATNKLYIHFSGGISDFKVNRY